MNAKIADLCSQIRRARPVSKIKSMNKGISQSTWLSWRASLKPLAESRRVRQLTCNQGRKKQIKTNPAALRVIRRTAFILRLFYFCGIAYLSYSIS